MRDDTTIPEELEKAVERGLESVRRHPQHDLSLGRRQDVWAAMGPRAPGLGVGGAGKKRRTSLAVAAVRRALPVWERAFPADDTPQQLLEAAGQVGAGVLGSEEALARLNEAWPRVVELAAETGDMAASVGLGAAQALSTAIRDESFDDERRDLEAADDGDIENADASFFAASAHAGGPVWEPKSDPSKRRDFWEWWLTEAVPAAWRSAA